MLKVALTHDVDRISKTYQHFTHFIRGIIHFKLKYSIYQVQSLFLKNNYWNFEEIIKIENEFKTKSTFFFLNESLPFSLFEIHNWKLSLGRYEITDQKVKDIITWLDKNGWEIGVHGSYNSYEDIELIMKEKEILEGIVKHEIIGIRQHYLNVTEKTWEIQNKAGFKYDSSYGYNKTIGFKDNRYSPFYPLNNDFIVFPLVIMDTPFIENKNRWELLDEIMDISIEHDALLVINWHNDKFNENEFPGFKTAYIEIIEKCISKGAIFFKLGEYYNTIKNNLQNQI